MLPLEGFYTAVGVIAGVAIAFLYQVIWKKAVDRIKDLSEREGKDAKIWLGDTWTKDIKQSVQEFYSYVNVSLGELESGNEELKFGELFSHTEKTPVLKKKLNVLTELYNGFSESGKLISKSRENHENIKKWTLRTIFSLFVIAVWGALGFLVDNSVASEYKIVYWVSIIPLLICLGLFSAKLAKVYTNCCNVDAKINAEKSKHPDALEVVV